MKPTYDEALQYNIDKAIKIIGEKHHEFTTIKDWLNQKDDSPAKIPSNPLLTDYNWVYEHAEELFCNSKLYYQKYQSTDAYYTLFKALTNKYSLENDYDEMLFSNIPALKMKWKSFAYNLIDFLTHAFDKRLKELLNKPDVINYFLKYQEIYDINTIMLFSHEGIEKFLEHPQIAALYTNNYTNLIQLIKNNPKITISPKIILSEKIIKDMSRTHHIEEFYYNLYFIREQVSDQPFLDEQCKFCDEQIKNIKNGIIPCYQEEYKKSKNEISHNELNNYNYMQRQVMERIFQKNNLETLPKNYLYQELSKYMIIGMYISRNYQTDPYNLLIDIETLQEFATTENRQLQGQEIYNFLTSFEDKTINEIIDFYHQGKSLPLMDILYDDWTTEKNKFIEELNSKMYMPLDNPLITKNNITYYDITDIEEPILVHNTVIEIDNKKKINEMIEHIKQGTKYRICLSIQDKNHNTFYEEDHTKQKRTIKLAYGPLTPNRVGTICHTDAYSKGATEIEIDNQNYKRRLYTMKSFMDKTTDYNELVYLINSIPFPPIGIICEDEITPEEQAIASELNIPILYRQKKTSTYRPYQEENLSKRYTYTVSKKIF